MAEDVGTLDGRAAVRPATGSTVRRLIPPGDRHPALDRLATLAARLLHADLGRVSLVTEERSLAAGNGPDAVPGPGPTGRWTPRDRSLSGVTASEGAPVRIHDTDRDDRATGVPSVSAGRVRAYLGVPLVTTGGELVGALGVSQHVPRAWTDDDAATLEQLAEAVVTELELGATRREYDERQLHVQLAVDAAGIGSFDWDLVTDALEWDDQLRSVFGYPTGSPITHIGDFYSRVHPDDRPDLDERVGEAVASCGAFRAAYRVVWPDGAVRFVEARGQVLADPAGRAARMLGAAYDVTESHAATTLAQQSTDRLGLLSAVAQALGTTLDTDEAVARLARIVVPRLGDWCVVTLVDEHDGLRDVASWHVRPELRPLVEQYAELRLPGLRRRSHLTRALSTALPVSLPSGAVDELTPEFTDPRAAAVLAELDPASTHVFPLRSRGHVLGLLTLHSGPARPPLVAADLQVAADVADRAGLSLETARLYEQAQDVSLTLQRSLLTAPPEPDHAQVVVRYTPAARTAQVGGDWYDAFLQPGGALVLVIGDVIGHDTTAAAAMGQLRGLLRGIAYTTGEGPSAVLTRVEDAMEGLLIDTSATAVVARLEQTEEELRDGVTRLRWSNAGHPPPLVLHEDGRVEVLEVEPDLPIGVLPGTDRADHEVVLPRGATVLIYTDGLVERRGVSIQDGIDSLVELLPQVGHLTLDDVVDQVIGHLVPDGSEDDLALLAVRLHPQDLPRPHEAGPNRLPPGVPREPAVPAPGPGPLEVSD